MYAFSVCSELGDTIVFPIREMFGRIGDIRVQEKHKRPGIFLARIGVSMYAASFTQKWKRI